MARDLNDILIEEGADAGRTFYDRSIEENGYANGHAHNGKASAPSSSPPPLVAKPLGKIDIAGLPRRQWLIGRRYQLQFLSATVAPGAAGKTMITLQDAISVCTGKGLNGERVYRQGPAWFINNEDPLVEMQRRVAAICLHFGIPIESLESRLFLNSGLERRVIVAKEMATGVIATPDVAALIQQIRDLGIVLLIVDPFVRVHQVKGNDNEQIDFVAEQFSKIAAETSCAIGLAHHTRKPPGASSDGHAGNPDSARGATALINACRMAHTLTVLSQKDAQDLGVSEEERRYYVRLDDAKSNMSPPGEATTYFRKTGVHLPNGDDVGVFVRTELSAEDFKLTPATAIEILKDVEAAWNTPMPFTKQGKNGLAPHMVERYGMTDAQARAIVRSWFASGMIELKDDHGPKHNGQGLKVKQWPGRM